MTDQKLFTLISLRYLPVRPSVIWLGKIYDRLSVYVFYSGQVYTILTYFNRVYIGSYKKYLEKGSDKTRMVNIM